MRLVCAARDLNRALAVPCKSGLCVRLTAAAAADTGLLGVTGDDHQVRVTTRVEASICEDGEFADVFVPASLLQAVAKQIPAGDVEIVITDRRVTLTGGGVVHSVLTVDKDLARMAEPAPLPKVFTELDVVEFRRAVTQVLPAVAKDDSNRGAITGIQFKPVNGALRVAGTDSYRLHVTETDAWDPAMFNSGCVVPGGAVRTMLAVFTGTDPVQLALEPDRITVQSPEACVSALLIMDPFPVFDGLIPDHRTAATHVLLDASSLLDALAVVNPVAKEGMELATVTVVPDENTVVVESTAADVGESRVVLPTVKATGDEMAFDTNTGFLATAVRAATAERVDMWFRGSLDPVLVRGFGAKGFLAIVMPVRLKSRR